MRVSMRRTAGKTIAEYALILALLVLVAIPALSYLGRVITEGYRQNEPTSKAGQLFALLGGSGQGMAGTFGENVRGVFDRGLFSSQPVDNVLFHYNSETGVVEVLLPDGSSAASAATSADGTRILAQNLLDAGLAADLAPEQQAELENLSRLAFKLAEEEEMLIRKYPQLADGENVNLKVFMAYEGQKVDSTIYYDYLAFTDAYERLSGQLGQSTDPALAAVKETVDTNATLVSQLAYKNFVEMQTQRKNGAASSTERKAEEAVVKAADVDITEITVEETPPETRAAGQDLRNSGV